MSQSASNSPYYRQRDYTQDAAYADAQSQQAPLPSAQQYNTQFAQSPLRTAQTVPVANATTVVPVLQTAVNYREAPVIHSFPLLLSSLLAMLIGLGQIVTPWFLTGIDGTWAWWCAGFPIFLAGFIGLVGYLKHSAGWAHTHWASLFLLSLAAIAIFIPYAIKADDYIDRDCQPGSTVTNTNAFNLTTGNATVDGIVFEPVNITVFNQTTTNLPGDSQDDCDRTRKFIIAFTVIWGFLDIFVLPLLAFLAYRSWRSYDARRIWVAQADALYAGKLIPVGQVATFIPTGLQYGNAPAAVAV